MSLRGVFGGLLTLTLLQAVLSSERSAERTGGIFRAVSSGFARFMSPTVEAIPDLRDRRKIVAPGPYQGPVIPLNPSSTMPPDWNTRPAPPRIVQT